tara:strand:- start:200 stop:415 length:216 start_codon:yes stop_codon:yes gene_type:complete
MLTICDRIRDLYEKLVREGNSHDEEIEEIYRCAKKMNKKLFEYKYGGELIEYNSEKHIQSLKRIRDAYTSK